MIEDDIELADMLIQYLSKYNISVTNFEDPFFGSSTLENATLFPKHLISDLPTDNDSRIDFVSYSIKVDDFLNFSLPIAIEYLESLDKWKLRRYKVPPKLRKTFWKAKSSFLTKRQSNDKIYLQETGLFDSMWYLMTYPDVAAADMNPVEAMEFINERIKFSKNNQEFLISMNG